VNSKKILKFVKCTFSTWVFTRLVVYTLRLHAHSIPFKRLYPPFPYTRIPSARPCRILHGYTVQFLIAVQQQYVLQLHKRAFTFCRKMQKYIVCLQGRVRRQHCWDTWLPWAATWDSCRTHLTKTQSSKYYADQDCRNIENSRGINIKYVYLTVFPISKSTIVIIIFF